MIELDYEMINDIEELKNFAKHHNGEIYITIDTPPSDLDEAAQMLADNRGIPQYSAVLSELIENSGHLEMNRLLVNFTLRDSSGEKHTLSYTEDNVEAWFCPYIDMTEHEDMFEYTGYSDKRPIDAFYDAIEADWDDEERCLSTIKVRAVSKGFGIGERKHKQVHDFDLAFYKFDSLVRGYLIAKKKNSSVE